MSAKTRAKPARERARQARRRLVRKRGRTHALGTALVVALFAALAAPLIFSRGSSRSEDAPAGRLQPVGAAVSIDPGAIKIGKPFPGFSVADAGGRVLTTKGSLSGKPTIIWFTTSYCVPCQVGAAPVARLDDQLGGKAFNVLMVFVDPSEQPSALESWREQFGNPDWIVTLDRGNTFARAVELRALDTKMLLDPSGVLEDVNLYPVDTAYLTLLEQAIQGTP